MNREDNSFHNLSIVMRNSGRMMSQELQMYELRPTERARRQIFGWLDSIDHTLKRIREAMEEDDRKIQERRNAR